MEVGRLSRKEVVSQNGRGWHDLVCRDSMQPCFSNVAAVTRHNLAAGTCWLWQNSRVTDMCTPALKAGTGKELQVTSLSIPSVQCLSYDVLHDPE